MSQMAVRDEQHLCDLLGIPFTDEQMAAITAGLDEPIAIIAGAWFVDPLLFDGFFNDAIVVLPEHPAMAELAQVVGHDVTGRPADVVFGEDDRSVLTLDLGLDRARELLLTIFRAAPLPPPEFATRPPTGWWKSPVSRLPTGSSRPFTSPPTSTFLPMPTRKWTWSFTNGARTLSVR